MPLCGYADGLYDLQNTNTGGGIGNDGVQHSVWVYALVCLFLSLFLEAPIEIQQSWRMTHTNAKLGYVQSAVFEKYIL